MTKYRTIKEAKKANPERFKLRKGPGGNNLCRWCSVEVTPPRRTFCSGNLNEYSRRKINGVWTKIQTKAGSGCVHTWMLCSSPQYARKAVFDRDQGVCAVCGLEHQLNGSWAADHIVPVWLNGGIEIGMSEESFMSNLQTLCSPCHKVKTAEEAKERAAIKKLSKKNKK